MVLLRLLEALIMVQHHTAALLQALTFQVPTINKQNTLREFPKFRDLVVHLPNALQVLTNRPRLRLVITEQHRRQLQLRFALENLVKQKSAQFQDMLRLVAL